MQGYAGMVEGGRKLETVCVQQGLKITEGLWKSYSHTISKSHEKQPPTHTHRHKTLLSLSPVPVAICPHFSQKLFLDYFAGLNRNFPAKSQIQFCQI